MGTPSPHRRPALTGIHWSPFATCWEGSLNRSFSTSFPIFLRLLVQRTWVELQCWYTTSRASPRTGRWPSRGATAGRATNSSTRIARSPCPAFQEDRLSSHWGRQAHREGHINCGHGSARKLNFNASYFDVFCCIYSAIIFIAKWSKLARREAVEAVRLLKEVNHPANFGGLQELKLNYNFWYFLFRFWGSGCKDIQQI